MHTQKSKQFHALVSERTNDKNGSSELIKNEKRTPKGTKKGNNNNKVKNNDAHEPHVDHFTLFWFSSM